MFCDWTIAMVSPDKPFDALEGELLDIGSPVHDQGAASSASDLYPEG
jgi:hypothetical protein